VLGGVAGGLLGSQIGGGNGKKLAAVLGAAGGAYAGHQVEKSRKETKRYEISVRMEDGALRSVEEADAPVWRIGDRVKFDNGRLLTAN
jgi:outer membrane lipoprotein SlyB